MGFVKAPDVDQTADSVVVTAQVPVERVGALEGQPQSAAYGTVLFLWTYKQLD